MYSVLKLVLIRNIACFVQLLFTSQMQLLSLFLNLVYCIFKQIM